MEHLKTKKYYIYNYISKNKKKLSFIMSKINLACFCWFFMSIFKMNLAFWLSY
ncbi:hypothetical Protein psc5_04550 [Candidatus Phytoplasma solani]